MQIIKDWSTARYSYKQEFEHYKRDSVRAAEDLGYSKDVIDKIKTAKTVGEITSIMRNARTNGESAIVDNFYDCSTKMGVSGTRRRNHV